MATRGSVTVSVPKTSTVQIYTSNSDGNYELIGSYKNVSGTQTLGFDIAKAKNNILVAANGSAYSTTVGGTVDFSSANRTRTMLNNNDDVIATTTSQVIPQSVVTAYTGVVPEENENLGKVTQNFKFVSNGRPFTIYPLYWNTSSVNSLGVYWTDDKGYHEEEFYLSKYGNELQIPSNLSQCTNCLYNGGTDEIAVGEKCKSDKTVAYVVPSSLTCSTWKNAGELVVGETCSVCGHVITELTENGRCHKYDGYLHYYINDESTEITGITPSINNTASSSSEPFVISTGITITIPANKEFGLFIKTYKNEQIDATTGKPISGDNYIFKRYSEASKNREQAGKNHDWDNSKDRNTLRNDQTKANTDEAYVFASYFNATVNGKKYTYLGFEDWAWEKTDLNDVIFMFDEDYIPTVIDNDSDEGSSWIIACEDLGDTDDYDFNDVVVRGSHVSGETTATITPLAAGGTLPATIYFNGEELGEIHRLISTSYAEPNASGSYTMLNTNANGGANPGEGQPKTVPVASDFSLAPSDGESSFGGFSIKVQSDDNEAKTITAPKTGKTPQMFMVDGAWKWPVERASIEKAYTSFSSWVGDANNTDWQTTKNASLIYGN